MKDQPIAGIVPDQFARGEMVLEIDDHAGVRPVVCGKSSTLCSTSLVHGRATPPRPDQTAFSRCYN
jgi:hypothetical protein